MYEETGKDLFALPVDALAHGCNTLGIMNAGIAREFKARYPLMFREYQSYCKSGDFHPGQIHFYHSTDSKKPHVINIAIQLDLDKGARLAYLEQGLAAVEHNHKRLGIKTLAMPRIGCDLGGLAWNDTRAIIQNIFRTSDLEVLVSHTEQR